MHREPGFPRKDASDATREDAGVRPSASHPVDSRGGWRGRIGEVLLEKWRVEAVLHQGFTSTLYRAVHLRNTRRVALKVLNRRHAETRANFQQEALVANAIDHPSVVRVLDDGLTDDGAPFMIMELLDGASLLQRHDEACGMLPVDDVVRWACQLLDALACAHARGIVHGNVKASNVVVTTAGDAKLVDFGAACVGAASADEDAIDPRSDIRAVGKLLHMLLGERALPRSLRAVIDRAVAAGPGTWDDAAAMREAMRWAGRTISPRAGAIPAPLSALAEDSPNRATLTDTPAAIPPDERTTHPHIDSLAPVATLRLPSFAAAKKEAEREVGAAAQVATPRRRARDTIAGLVVAVTVCAVVTAVLAPTSPLRNARHAGAAPTEATTAPLPVRAEPLPNVPPAAHVAAPTHETLYAAHDADDRDVPTSREATKRKNATWLSRYMITGPRTPETAEVVDPDEPPPTEPPAASAATPARDPGADGDADARGGAASTE